MYDFTEIIKPEVQEYISENLNVNLGKFLLKKSPFPNVSIQEIAQQIKGRQIATKKFPFLLVDKVVFPPHLNIEQASSQDTAIEKAKNLNGDSFLDLTCGLGIDAFFLSQNFKEVTLIEQNTELLNIVKHNWQILGRNAHFVNENLEIFLHTNTKKFDLIYIDPARRDENLSKKFLLKDLSPNILEIQNQLLSISKKIMIKLSPLIDLKYLQNHIDSLEEIEIIAVKNEVKEVILHITVGFENETKITAKNLLTTEKEFSFFSNEENTAQAEFSDILKYLYIPNNAVLKSGAFNLIAKKFGLKKLHPNTHFYTSDLFLENFCGRVFQVEKINTKSLKKGQQYNIISKNHPLSPEQIKSKYKLNDGGENYLFFTQSINEKLILVSKNFG